MDQLDVSQPSVSFDLKASAHLTDLSDSYWTGKVKLMKQKDDGTWEKIDIANDKVHPNILSYLIIFYPTLSQFYFILGGAGQ